MNAAQEEDQQGEEDLPWVDYQPGSPGNYGVTHLRIGFLPQERQANTIPISLRYHGFLFDRTLRQVKIYLPAVASIGDNFFERAKNLERVEFVPGSSDTDGDDAESVRSCLFRIGDMAFCDCNNLRSVIGLEHAAASLEGLGTKVFIGSMITTIDLSNATAITRLPQFTFAYCEALTTVRLPPRLRIIRMAAFLRCRALGEITLPPTLTTLGNGAFVGCTALSSIRLPASLRSMEGGCFNGCKQLACVYLESLQVPLSQSHDLFGKCTSLHAVELPVTVRREQWPMILERMCQDGDERGIQSAENRHSIVWNFLCQNMAQYFVESTANRSRRRRRVG